MNISVRLEGGLGDCLLGNRFVAAIKEKYPQADITAYIDSEGKIFQKECLDILYPSMYKDIKIIPNKKYREFWVDCQFGIDNYFGALENVPDDYLLEMHSYDKFYDLHIDSLKWTQYDFDWLRYFKFFPKPELKTNNEQGDYIVLHLVSSTSIGHILDQQYIETLIKNLSSNDKIYIISTEDTNYIYDNIKYLYNVNIVNDSLENICKLISNAKFMLSTDSGFRYIAYSYGVPTLTFSSQSTKSFSSVPSHYVRWLMFPETCFPLNYDINHMLQIINNILKDPAYILTPYLVDFDSQAVRRNYSINLEKTKR